MNAAKAGPDIGASKVNWLVRMTSIVHHIPGGALIFSILPLTVLGYLAWFLWGAQHIDIALYSLKREHLIVTPQPNWISSDVVQEVFENGRLSSISLLAPDSNATIAHAFQAHPWIRRATRVSKRPGAKVEVDLVYRKPLAMVFYEKKRGLFPVDDEGIVL
ncbi:MAG: hypothetical protein KDB03_22795, partial [Planctomycetales bacterium]|nr:hypothetical protein [Planctomycetales bacterium]